MVHWVWLRLAFTSSSLINQLCTSKGNILQLLIAFYLNSCAYNAASNIKFRYLSTRLIAHSRAPGASNIKPVVKWLSDVAALRNIQFHVFSAFFLWVQLFQPLVLYLYRSPSKPQSIFITNFFSSLRTAGSRQHPS
jgi:hypothetical protein